VSDKRARVQGSGEQDLAHVAKSRRQPGGGDVVLKGKNLGTRRRQFNSTTTRSRCVIGTVSSNDLRLSQSVWGTFPKRIGKG